VAVILPSGPAQSAAAAQEGRAGDLQLRALAAHELRTVRRIRAGSSGSGPECVRIRHTRGRCIEWRAADGANIERAPRYPLQSGQIRQKSAKFHSKEVIYIKILVDKLPGQKSECPFSTKAPDDMGYTCEIKKRKTRGPFACTREQCPYLRAVFEPKNKQ